MIIETYHDIDYYERRYMVEGVFIDPNDLYESVVKISAYLFNNGVPTKAQTWTCRPNHKGVGWRINVLFVLNIDQLIRDMY